MKYFPIEGLVHVKTALILARSAGVIRLRRRMNIDPNGDVCDCVSILVGIITLADVGCLLRNSLTKDYSAFANSCPLQTATFLFPLIHSHNVILSSNKF